MRDTVESRQIGFTPRGNEFAHLGDCTTRSRPAKWCHFVKQHSRS